LLLLRLHFDCLLRLFWWWLFSSLETAVTFSSLSYSTDTVHCCRWHSTSLFDSRWYLFISVDAVTGNCCCGDVTDLTVLCYDTVWWNIPSFALYNLH
jgi:hypothetical protein